MKRLLQIGVPALFIGLVVNSGYLAAFPSATVFYMGNVLAHLVVGVLLLFALLLASSHRREVLGGAKVPLLLYVTAMAVGLVIVYKGNLNENRNILLAHIGIAALAVLALIPFVWKQASEKGGGWLQFKKGFSYALIALIGLPLVSMGYEKVFPNPNDRITNPLVVPTEMKEEGGGPNTPFFPSSAQTNVKGIIPSNFFMDSEACGDCHKQAYDEWKSSSHHFGSFNNQFYRKAIEYMQDVQGPQSSKWCAGCHDHAVFFNGRFEKPIKDQIDTPEAQAGLACTSCHAISKVDSTMGNGGFTIEYPALHEYMSSKNKYIRAMNHFLVNLNPEPHRKTFIKPFMKKDTSEFCSSCHKVHLDIPVNNYRWFRGFNDYDNWQASGVSGQGARSFYYPPKTSTCGDCHMPQEDSKEPGHKNGKIHSHRFATANTALSTVNKDAVQLAETQKFLKSGFITMDIFSASPVEENKGQTTMIRREAKGPKTMSSIAAGEESDQAGDVFIREVGKVSAPLNKAGLKLTPGSTARIDVVTRTRKIGHAFPGGTLDSFDIWIEMQAKDATGKVIYWSGQVDEEGKGHVEPGAHFFKAFQLDAEGNPINKRNAWQSRTVLYVRQIGPGAADTSHFLLRIPKDAKGPITLTAKLNYRKFSRYYTEFAYAGQPKPGQDPALLSKHFNSMEYSFDPKNIPANVSNAIKDRIPDLPITVLAESKVDIALTTNAKETEWKQVATKADRERWNDWGIGMLLQGDLKGAEYAFTKVTEAEPGYADGWLNVARALVQEGETEAAKPFIQKSLATDNKLGRTYYFKALIEKADGNYDEALKSLKVVTDKYPRDRVVQNQVGRILFLQRKYKESIEALKMVNAVDPEDLQMHYTLMLAYRGLGDKTAAEREEKLFRRFKAEESSQSLTAKRRLASPEENNERQVIHDHESVDLTPKAKPSPREVAGKKPGSTPAVAKTAGKNGTNGGTE